MTLVVDANVAIKWFVPQVDRTRALALQSSGDKLIAPTLLLSECAKAIWSHHRIGDISDRHARLALTALPTLFGKLFDDQSLAGTALDLAISIDHPPYDCFYLALAEREGAKLVTADQTFYDKLLKKRRAKHVVMLHNWSPTP